MQRSSAPSWLLCMMRLQDTALGRKVVKTMVGVGQAARRPRPVLCNDGSFPQQRASCPSCGRKGRRSGVGDDERLSEPSLRTRRSRLVDEAVVAMAVDQPASRTVCRPAVGWAPRAMPVRLPSMMTRICRSAPPPAGTRRQRLSEPKTSCGGARSCCPCPDVQEAHGGQQVSWSSRICPSQRPVASAEWADPGQSRRASEG